MQLLLLLLFKRLSKKEVKLLNNTQIEKLKENWGEKAESMNCLAEVRLFDPLSTWECYIYALNPADEDEIACIINGFGVELTTWSLNSLSYNYNAYGEPPSVDKEYRPRRASELFKKLSLRECYESRRY